jgi:hypothetical protein
MSKTNIGNKKKIIEKILSNNNNVRSFNRSYDDNKIELEVIDVNTYDQFTGSISIKVTDPDQHYIAINNTNINGFINNNFFGATGTTDTFDNNDVLAIDPTPFPSVVYEMNFNNLINSSLFEYLHSGLYRVMIWNSNPIVGEITTYTDVDPKEGTTANVAIIGGVITKIPDHIIYFFIDQPSPIVFDVESYDAHGICGKAKNGKVKILGIDGGNYGPYTINWGIGDETTNTLTDSNISDNELPIFSYSKYKKGEYTISISNMPELKHGIVTVPNIWTRKVYIDGTNC